MCGPMTVGAVLGAGQAVAGHMSAVSEGSASNRNKARIFKSQQAKVISDHYTNINDFYLRGVDAEIQWDQNATDYSWYVAEQQNEINKIISAAFKAQEKGSAQVFSEVRTAKSLERSGKSAKRVGLAIRAAYGRGVAEQHAKLDKQRDDFSFKTMAMLAKKNTSDRKARTMIGLPPERGRAPMKPTWDRGPGMFSLIAGVAAGVTTGRFAGAAAKGVPVTTVL